MVTSTCANLAPKTSDANPMSAQGPVSSYSVNDQTYTESEIVRGPADDVDAEGRRRNRQRTVARKDGNVINFDGTQVEPAVQPNVESAAAFEREAGRLVAIIGRASTGLRSMPESFS